jgi:hypothetical protein
MSRSIPKSGTVYFDTEEQMDGFLKGMNPGSTVIVKEHDTTNLCWECRWLPGTDIGKYFNEGATSDEEIYFYNEERLWVEIPAFN